MLFRKKTCRIIFLYDDVVSLSFVARVTARCLASPDFITLNFARVATKVFEFAAKMSTTNNEKTPIKHHNHK